MCLKEVINTSKIILLPNGRKRVCIMKNTKNLVNSKLTKAELLDFIKTSTKSVKDKGLKDRIAYTLKKSAEATKSDLLDLANDVAKVVLSAFDTPTAKPVEASKKPTLKKSDNGDNTDNKTPAKKTTTTKKGASLKKSDKEKVETANDLNVKQMPMATIFPATIDHDYLGKLVACPDKYKTIKEIAEAFEKGVNLVFCTYWTKRHIKEYAYKEMYQVPVPKDGFAFDLDTCQALYVCDNVPRIYALSTYTEAMFRFEEDDLKPVDCTAPDGTKFRMRYSSGMEFEIYEIAEAKE